METIGFEIVKILVLFIIALEGYKLAFEKNEAVKATGNSRRELNGTFKDPQGYRTNSRGQYVPIKPNSRMIDGSDEDDEV